MIRISTHQFSFSVLCLAAALFWGTKASALTVSASVVHSCATTCTGSIQLTVQGGTAPLTYKWTDGASTKDRMNLCAGKYKVKVTDANGNKDWATVVVNNSGTGSLQLSVQRQEPCPGACNGGFIVTASGTGALTYAWSDGVTTKDRSGLCCGSYALTVTNGCGASATYSDTFSCRSVLTATVTQTLDPTCANTQDGEIHVAALAGTGQYQYLWSNGSTAQNLSQVGSGAYCVTVSDGCSSVQLCDSLGYQRDTTLGMIVGFDKSQCLPLACDNKMFPIIFGRDGRDRQRTGLSYVWSNSHTGDTLRNVCVNDIHCLTVTDATCNLTRSHCTSIPLQSSPSAFDVVTEDNVCDTFCTSHVDFEIVYGVPPYTYSYRNFSATTNKHFTVTGLCHQEVVDIEITDACGQTGTVQAVGRASFNAPEVVILPGDTVVEEGEVIHFRVFAKNTTGNEFCRWTDRIGSPTTTTPYDCMGTSVVAGRGQQEFYYKLTDQCGIAKKTIRYTGEMKLLKQGVRHEQAAKFQVFPNPSSGMFTLSAPVDDEDRYLAVMDVAGRSVWSAKWLANQPELSINLDLPAGTYTINLSGLESYATIVMIQ